MPAAPAVVVVMAMVVVVVAPAPVQEVAAAARRSCGGSCGSSRVACVEHRHGAKAFEDSCLSVTGCRPTSVRSCQIMSDFILAEFPG